MAVTVEDLVQLAFPPGTRLLAGSSGLHREVVWARSLRPRPPAFETLEGGELALISTAHLSLLRGSLSLSHVVGRLASVGVAAVAVQGDVDPKSVETAERLGIPLIQLPVGVSLVEIERGAIATIVDRQAELQRRASDIYRDLAQLTFEQRGLQAVVDRLAEMTGRSVSIEDDQFLLQFAASGVGVPHPEQLDLRDAQREIGEWVHGVPMSSTQPPVARFAVAGGRLARFVAPIITQEGVAGYLSIVGAASALTDLDRLAAGRAAAVCAMEVAKEAAVGEAEARLRGDLLDQLLSLGVEGDQAVLGKAGRLGYDLSLPSLVLAFRAEMRPSSGADAPSAGADRVRARLESLVRVEMSRREQKALVALRGNNVVVVVPVRSSRPDQSGGEMAEEMRRRFEETLSGWWVAAGVGRSTHAGANLATSYREAEEALDIGVRIHGRSSTTFFGDLGIMRLLAQVRSLSELEGFHGEMLGKLEDHDRRAGGELLRSLEAFFQCHGNLSRTAELLCLHRNSLLYRLQRIREITGHDMDDPETRLSLQVAIKVRRMLEAERGRGAR